MFCGLNGGLMLLLHWICYV